MIQRDYRNNGEYLNYGLIDDEYLNLKKNVSFFETKNKIYLNKKTNKHFFFLRGSII